MALIRTLFWVLLFVFFTFSFEVLFKYGTSEFVPGFKKDLNGITTFVQDAIHPGKKKKDNNP